MREGMTAIKACHDKDARGEKLSCRAEHGNADRQIGT